MSNLRRRIAAYVRDHVPAHEAAKVTDEVLQEILANGAVQDDIDVEGHVDAARRRLQDAELFRQGFTLEQLESYRLHYAH